MELSDTEQRLVRTARLVITAARDYRANWEDYVRLEGEEPEGLPAPEPDPDLSKLPDHIVQAIDLPGYEDWNADELEEFASDFR